MEKFKKFLTARNIVLAVCVVVFCISAGVLLHKFISEQNAQNKFESLSGTANTESSEVVGVVSGDEAEDTIFTYLGIEDPGKNLDWEELWKQNKDIYAWIYIPGTNVDYPILQHETDDSYYLNHNLDGTRGYPGCIYTEKMNAKDFTDYNTLIYGHNMKNGTMFNDLHKFNEYSFFKEHRYMFIYMPDQLLVYDIFGAYKFTNEHILYSYDCFSEEGFTEYMEMVYERYRYKGNFRDDVEVTGKDHIITLSTCIGNDSYSRFLVQGVLVEYEAEE